MKYWDLIIVDGKTSPPTTSVPTAPADEQVEIINNKLDQILSQMNIQLSSEETSLTDDEVNDILEILLSYEEKYFSEIPLSKVLNKSFIWNIPKEIYKSATLSVLKDEDPYFNPLFWLYPLLTECPEDVLPKFMVLAFNNMDQQEVEKRADQYDETYLNIEFNDDVEYIDIENDSDEEE